MLSTKGGISAHNFQFEIYLEKIELGINFACTLSVIWKRGNKFKIQTEK